MDRQAVIIREPRDAAHQGDHGVFAPQRDARRGQRGVHAQRMMTAMQDVLASGDPARTPGADVTLRQQFDACERGLQDFASEPAMEAGLRAIFGRLALAHGEYERGERNLRRAVALHGSQGAAEPEVAGARFALAGALHKLNRYSEAEAEYRAALALREASFGPHAPEVAESLSGLAWVVKDQDRYDEAEALYGRALEILRVAPGDQRLALADVSNNFAQLLTRRARYDEAEPFFRSALALRRELFGDDHQHVATTLKNLGNMLRDAGDLRQAAELLEQAHEMLARLLGPEHPTTIVSMNELGLVLKDYGDYAAAEPLLRRALELRVLALGGERYDNVAVSKHNLAVALAGLRRYDEAKTLLDEALQTWRQTLPDAEHSYKVAVGLHSLADCTASRGGSTRRASRPKRRCESGGRFIPTAGTRSWVRRLCCWGGSRWTRATLPRRKEISATRWSSLTRCPRITGGAGWPSRCSAARCWRRASWRRRRRWSQTAPIGCGASVLRASRRRWRRWWRASRCTSASATAKARRRTVICWTRAQQKHSPERRSLSRRTALAERPRRESAHARAAITT